MLERSSFQGTIEITVGSNLPSSELASQQLSQRFRDFTNRQIAYSPNFSGAGEGPFNSTDIVLLDRTKSPNIEAIQEDKQARAAWESLLGCIPAERKLYDERELAHDRDANKDRIEFGITMGQTERGALVGIEEGSEEMTIWAKGLSYCYKFHPDGKISVASLRARDFWIDEGQRPTRVSAWERPLLESEVDEVSNIIDSFESFARVNGLEVRQQQRRVSLYT